MPSVNLIGNLRLAAERVRGDLSIGIIVSKIERYVNQWLDTHPEATTTVQDGSISQVKIAAENEAEEGCVPLSNDGGTFDWVPYSPFAYEVVATVDDATGEYTPLPTDLIEHPFPITRVTSADMLSTTTQLTGTLTWISSNTSILRVNNRTGILDPVGRGSVIITATNNSDQVEKWFFVI